MVLHDLVTNWSVAVKANVQLRKLDVDSDFAPSLETIQALHRDIKDTAPVFKDTLQRLIDLIKEYDEGKSDGTELLKAVEEFEKLA